MEFKKFLAVTVVLSTVLLFVLKVAQVGLAATWPWWVVLTPILAPVAGFGAVLAGAFALDGLAATRRYFARRSRLKRMYLDD